MLHLTRANQVVGAGKDINDIMDEISDCCYLIVVPQKHTTTLSQKTIKYVRLTNN